MAILSIQSQVLNGSVGNAGAAFIYARLGHEVWPLPTTLLSHHPGHGGAEGGPVAPASMAALIQGLAARGAFARCAAVASGYLGAAAAVPVVCDAVARARAAHPAALYACDPVIGDAGRVYVPAALVAAFRDVLLPLADIAFPNPFELEILTGRALADRASAFAAMAALGPPIVVLTGFTGADTAPRMLDVLLLTPEARHFVPVSKLDRAFSGAGDAFAALFMARYLRDHDAVAALNTACAASAALLAATAQAGGDELAIVTGQAAWVAAASGATAR
ncbi:MAG: pyridoxal kinase [Acidiphilium sp. 37-64-53]|uniref:pyridoxal kinase n=1 Tax=Acidiphilium TaxID=522 RepID=UPI000BCA220E|nr:MULTISPECIES: pyridoxal kinase [Acidiphilium]OYW02909.1 MAG: pyridoxal kinase [Acidiphilium sp. 37-64-53]OZB28788.1 MAG: pyridoxal kinase [Acidiphilium sp. 34-64-41]HQT84692.1 pyridoxal kinase [Acidiphilium rubrum]